jgi:ribosomal 30S subunit maturation factor RimM
MPCLRKQVSHCLLLSCSVTAAHRSQAEQLQSYTVHIPVAERERLRDPDEFWVQDLAGCEVFLKVRGVSGVRCESHSWV